MFFFLCFSLPTTSHALHVFCRLRASTLSVRRVNYSVASNKHGNRNAVRRGPARLVRSVIRMRALGLPLGSTMKRYGTTRALRMLAARQTRSIANAFANTRFRTNVGFELTDQGNGQEGTERANRFPVKSI